MGSAVDFGGGFSSQKVSICTALHRWAVYNLGISRWRWHPPGGCHRGGLSLLQPMKLNVVQWVTNSYIPSNLLTIHSGLDYCQKKLLRITFLAKNGKK